MEARFDAKKTQIVQRLARPEGEYNDASPKGSVDENIRELVAEINGTTGFVTTSSCSGRVAVYLEGPKRPVDSGDLATQDRVDERERSANNAPAPTSGKGGGRWLFTSHEPVDVAGLSDEGTVYASLGIESATYLSFPQDGEKARFVHLKFEPLILHILTSTREKAQLALNAASAAGFRESGISSLMDSKGTPTPPMVAVRSSGMAFDTIVAALVNDKMLPMVSEDYLRTLLRTANDHFIINEQRKTRFRQAFASLTAPSTTGTFKSKAGRPDSYSLTKPMKERQRRKEARKTAASEQASTGAGRLGGEGEADSDFGLHLDEGET